MSGGHYDYEEAYLQSLADRLRIDALSEDPIPPEVRGMMLATAKTLDRMYMVIHAIDYYRSGDSGPERMFQLLEQAQAEVMSKFVRKQ